ncbi:MAG: DUF4491 family protein [Bacteroidaceae bacterium]
MELHFEGWIIGAFTFLIIGVFHPVVVKTEYYWGTRYWWVFLVMGLVACGAAVVVASTLWSSLLSVFAFSSFWTIKELFEQTERVRKGWFPKNPNRRAT